MAPKAAKAATGKVSKKKVIFYILLALASLKLNLNSQAPKADGAKKTPTAYILFS